MVENKLKKIGIALSIITSCVISVFIIHQQTTRRRRQKRRGCYLEDDIKPQSTFKRVLADNSFSPFKHLSFHEKSSNSHPYEREIRMLLQNLQIETSMFDEYLITGMTKSHVWVHSEPQLRELADMLTKEKVFAVDTEQHGLRSFLGFTALVQVSTQKEDYLVDTIALHDVMNVLQPVFADPNILKVFHGADNDVLWLQRDFHIYVVNMFDTAKACEILSKPHKSLAYLLETYCGVTANKSLQREDWRQRPLPKEMVEYARADAHYLLYIARCLIEEIRAKDEAHHSDGDHFLFEASRRSNATCLQLYVKEDEGFPGESVASSILRNLACRGIDSSQPREGQFQDLIRKLCAWRDLMARVHDESLRYVLSDQAVIALADKIPSSETEIYSAISEADQENDASASCLFSISPSPVICSHWDDVQCLIVDVQSSSVEVLQNILRKHLGPNGSCSLSIYNYNILSKSNLKFAIGSASMQNGMKNGMKNGKQTVRKASRELFVQKFSCKAPVYHNCRIYANDGRLLCYCDRRKLEWYLNRNLAKLVDDDPPAIMLLFEPKGRPEDEGNDFYIQSKRNMCVGCGESKHYLRYRIIPSCYRMHFPEHLKSHRSHDIVLLCVDCHEVAHAAAEKHKRLIAAEFGIPLFIRKMVDSGQTQLTDAPISDEHQEEGVSPLQLRIAAMALQRHGPRMPPKRREELMEIVRTYYGRREISSEDLENALLAGMSSRGRRKFEKKKGASNKQFAGNSISNDAQEDTSEDTSSLNCYTPETSGLDETVDIKDQGSHQDLVNNAETDVRKHSFSSEMTGRDDKSDVNTISLTTTTTEVSKVSDVNHFEETGDSETPIPVIRKGNSKVSLLGHGPHGKEVVDYLLRKYGEAGVQEFCQRWRQVFVDTVHPRYLPAGWDIKHSGRRDFGDYSVYNPTKKTGEDIQV